MKLRLFSAFHVSLAICAGFGLIAPAGADPKPLIWPPVAQVGAQYDMFTLEFESLGADDGDVIIPEEPDGGCTGEGCTEYPEYPEYPEVPPVTEVPERSEPEGREPPAATISQTNLILANLQGTANFCDSNYPLKDKLEFQKYRIDCLRWELHRIAQGIPSSGDYADMRDAISAASGELAAIVAQNADPAPPVAHVGRSRSNKARPSARRLKAIAPARQARANAQAEAVLDKLSTRLLRSASSSASKRVHYERAAQAINSTKVLLRST
ncbi:hypothetical protein EGN72_13490 [Pseudorhodobacter sp. E13]|uniref:hypothetical protein n=1 Tax=Pseudorhodobacter sp. E13 TaxID=2487931 RepID=UPI000F8E360B|nr:hypothetical protein [Pseudorhodobacter sp. E13]RUS59706.1 hypothetical protein EGN72_13490 [Pseudorhodobacter sp. E13]